MSYEDIAPYYDGIMRALGRWELEVPLWRRLATESGSPVLEVGCGTGRLLSALVDLVKVEGLDSSPTMLAIARGKPELARVRFHLGDMASFEVAGRFRLVFLGASQMQHLREAGDRAKTLKCCLKLACPGGIVALTVTRVPAGEERSVSDLGYDAGLDAHVEVEVHVKDGMRHTEVRLLRRGGEVEKFSWTVYDADSGGIEAAADMAGGRVVRTEELDAKRTLYLLEAPG